MNTAPEAAYHTGTEVRTNPALLTASGAPESPATYHEESTMSTFDQPSIDDRDLDGCPDCDEDHGPNDACPAIDGPQDDDHLNRNHETVEQRYQRAREQSRTL